MSFTDLQKKIPGGVNSRERGARKWEISVLHHVPEGTVFQLHGASPQVSRRVRDFLDREFPDLWLGRGGSFLWPLPSPDLTPLDF